MRDIPRTESFGISTEYGKGKSQSSFEVEAYVRASLILSDEWNSKQCAVCGSPKWSNHPFCRLCSIALQRVGLMEQGKVFCGRPAMRISRLPRMAGRWLRWYDTCRD